MEENHTTTTINTEQRGTAWSYTAGFIASLVLTIIPYLLVTRQIFLGTTLLIMILALGVLQMFVQMFFFLHLGRGPKPLYNVVFFTATAGLIIMVVGASLLIMSNLYRNMSPDAYTLRLAQEENISQVDGKSTGACQENSDNNASHMIMVVGSQISPQHINAKRCDTLIFMSQDNKNHTFDFGSPEKSVNYGGQFEVALTDGHSQAVVLNQVGDFSYFDSANHAAVGSFTVSQ